MYNDTDFLVHFWETREEINTWLLHSNISTSSKYFLTQIFFRLKELIPTVSAKDNVTQLDIILEAIRYIDSLQNKLADKIDNGEIELVKVNQWSTEQPMSLHKFKAVIYW